MAKKIVGVFDSEQEASRAIEDLKRQGFSSDDISIVAKNRDDVDSITNETGAGTAEDIATGAATGGVIGGATGLIAGLAALAIPGVGPILAAGPIAAALTGAAVGAGAGGLIGGLTNLGFSEDEAREYDSNFNDGKILVLVDSDTVQGEAAHDILRSNRSVDMNRNDYNTADLIGGHHDTSGVLGLGKTDVMDRQSSEPDVWKSSDRAQGRMETTNLPLTENGQPLSLHPAETADEPNSMGSTRSQMTENGQPLSLHPEETAESQDDIDRDRKLRLREEQRGATKDPFNKDQF
jgi:uncharacterized membrane protein